LAAAAAASNYCRQVEAAKRLKGELSFVLARSLEASWIEQSSNWNWRPGWVWAAALAAGYSNLAARRVDRPANKGGSRGAAAGCGDAL